MNEEITNPDVKYWVVVDNYKGIEHIFTEAHLKNVFGEERWLRIRSGLDDYFEAFEYIPK